ncbi:MAG: site-specific DNA-methyltransferase [Helicobacteraceae bacterium]|jgi:hypothetical protein|nr:site-specific DNA-methyltransferase [Helicobacteraceae bacterium]
MGRYNDINTNDWQSYSNIWTDSLWLIDRRDNSGAHGGVYHGNFVPQIPYQLLSRYTRKGDWALDPFMGSGTTLIEAQRVGRNSIGIELQKSVVNEAIGRICSENRVGTIANAYVGDSCSVNVAAILEQNGLQQVQFVILHPPYLEYYKVF